MDAMGSLLMSARLMNETESTVPRSEAYFSSKGSGSLCRPEMFRRGRLLANQGRMALIARRTSGCLHGRSQVSGKLQIWRNKRTNNGRAWTRIGQKVYLKLFRCRGRAHRKVDRAQRAVTVTTSTRKTQNAVFDYLHSRWRDRIMHRHTEDHDVVSDAHASPD